MQGVGTYHCTWSTGASLRNICSRLMCIWPFPKWSLLFTNHIFKISTPPPPCSLAASWRLIIFTPWGSFMYEHVDFSFCCNCALKPASFSFHIKFWFSYLKYMMTALGMCTWLMKVALFPLWLCSFNNTAHCVLRCKHCPVNVSIHYMNDHCSFVLYYLFSIHTHKTYSVSYNLIKKEILYLYQKLFKSAGKHIYKNSWWVTMEILSNMKINYAVFRQITAYWNTLSLQKL